MTRHLVIATLAALTAAAAADPKDTKNDQAAARQQAIEQARKAGIIGKAPPAELAEVGKLMTGTWKCESTLELPNQPPAKMKAKVTSALELGGFWIHETIDVEMAPAIKVEAYMTFDGTKWHRTAFDSMGGQATGTADPMKDHKIEWAIENGSLLEKVRADFSDLKKGMHLTAERSVDQGKTWGKGLDMTCKK